MNISGSHAAVSWADVHTYGELLTGRGDSSALGSFTQMFAIGQSSRITLAEEAPGQRMCSLFSQDDIVGGRDLYDRCPTWSDVTPEFAKGMVFKDKDAVIRACNWYHKQHGFFEIKQYPGPHTCLHGMESLDHRNINSTFIAHLIKTQVAEDPGWKIASIVENVKNYSGFTVSYKKAWLGRTKAIAMVFGDWDASYEKLPRFMRMLELRNPGTAVILETLDLDIMGQEGVTLISDRHAAIMSVVKHEWETSRLGQPARFHRYCLRHFRSNYHKNFGNVKVKDLIWQAGTVHQVRKFNEVMDEIKNLGTKSESAARAYRALCNEDLTKWILAHDGGYRWGVTTTNDSECYNNVLKGARDLPITSCVQVTFYRLVATFNDKRRKIESALARGLRYTSKVQAKLEEYQARSAEHHVTICNWASGSAEVITSAAGIKENHKHAVFLNPPSCDCGKWMIYHYPCSHMLAVCVKSGRQPWHLIDPKYRMDVYTHVYDTSFEPMVHEHYWATYDGPKIIPHPSRRRNPTSGRPTKRIHNEMDVSRKHQNNHCGICKEQGHDRRPMDSVGSPGPIDGTVLILQAHHRSTWIWKHGGTDALACRRCGSGLYDGELDPRVLQYVLRAGFYGAFSVIPLAEKIDSGRLRMSWLRRTFDVLLEHADDVSVQCHARAYMLRLIGGLLLTNYSQTLEHVLGYEDRPEADCRSTTSITAFTYRGLHFPGGPWGARWRSRFRTTTTSTHVVRVYRDQLDRLRSDEFTWRPYDGIMHELPDYCQVASDIWVSKSPLVCFEDVKWHLPDQFHGEHIDHWHHRHEYLVVGVIDDAAMHYDDLYMVWYRHITRTLVGNPAHRPTSGYVEIGSTIEIADMYDARDMCNRALHALHEHERIGQPGVPEPPPTIPPVVPAASPAMPPAFPVHPPPSTSSSQQFMQYVSATQTLASYVTPTMPSYTYHISSHDEPSSSRSSSSGVKPRRTTHRHITSPITYDRCSSFSPVGDDDEFDGYVDPLLASRGQMEILVSVEGVSQITQMPKRKGNFDASSSRSVPSDETVENQSSAIHVVRTYTDPVDNKWYGQKRCFVNKPILMHDTMGPVSHIFIGKASLCPPTGVTDDKCIRFPWEDLLDKCCEQEMYCRWHGLRVPKARSATLFDRGSPNSQVIKALEREIDEMQQRLDKYHFTEYAKKECVDPTQRIIEINIDPLLVSDLELSDFSKEEGDDDFVNYLPSSISVAGKPLCCYEHGP
ncbi:hypothetical protein Acr_25g0000970 [Actinidia rufa]|uniref:SWIM-type domain-containing protein n=1 Tax=Actinidia rufa TaxID=165716 RepID=A0A7J0GY83_9ERIC|nr:hypothetical protein Acr_25g0000970 [Actinidia rufa]